MPYAPDYKEKMNNTIEALIPLAPDFISKKEIIAKGFRPAAVGNALRRLVKAGLVTKAWHNAGYPVFYITPLPKETTNG
jgi:hypothetical protein